MPPSFTGVTYQSGVVSQRLEAAHPRPSGGGAINRVPTFERRPRHAATRHWRPDNPTLEADDPTFEAEPFRCSTG